MERVYILSNDFLSHPNKLYINHISNMLLSTDSNIEHLIKLYHDIAKLKNSFQKYIRGESVKEIEKRHSLLSFYFFLSNSELSEIENIIGFSSIVYHHGSIPNLSDYSKLIEYLSPDSHSFKREIEYSDEVLKNASSLEIYPEISFDKEKIIKKIKKLNGDILLNAKKNKFGYEDYVKIKKIYGSLFYSDKYEAIFSKRPEHLNHINHNDIKNYIDGIENKCLSKIGSFRKDFRKKVLEGFNKNHRLYRITAPTGYGKTLTSLEFATLFEKERIIYALPFTSIIDQTYEVMNQVFKSERVLDEDFLVSKLHHKTLINEADDNDRYSKIKFLTESFSGNITITTIYRLIFTLFGNSNSDGVQFNQLKNSVVIVDEIQSFPTRIRKDFVLTCKLISELMDTVFIFMSATMPVIADDFIELSNNDFFSYQNRYKLHWLGNLESELVEKIVLVANTKNTLVVVNTKKKAQELYHVFKNQYDTYSLTSLMYDEHKRKIIDEISLKIKKNKENPEEHKPVLLVSTQSIEAGVDLDFDVGFREIAPLSSVVQTAGRVNRNFNSEMGELYIFGDVSGYSYKIYSDELNITDWVSDEREKGNISFYERTLKDQPLCENDLFVYMKKYFDTIEERLENFTLKRHISQLAFADINREICKILDNDNPYTITVVIEDEPNFISTLETKLEEIKNDVTLEKFKKRDIVENIIKRMMSKAISIPIIEYQKYNIKHQISHLSEVFYVPYEKNVAGIYDQRLGWVLNRENFL